MSFPKYPEYKDSGVEWLGEVPSHWGVVPLRGASKQEAYSFTDGDWVESPYITDEGVRLIQTGNIGVGKYREQGFRYISEDTFKKLNCTEFSPGDVLICRLADPVGRACLAPDLGGRMITSVDVCILKTRDEIDSNFLVYYLSSEPYLSFMSSVSRGGTRERVSRSFLGGVRVSMPSLEEQHTISSFLDHETARIDALVEEQQRLIELLKEKRQAVISHAVTKGLDPSVPMKDSGVEWLGEVPEHWEVLSLRRVTNFIQTGGTPSTYQPSEEIEDGIDWFTPGDFGESLILGSSVRKVKCSPGSSEGVKIFPRDSVYIVGIGATLGKVGYATQAASANQQINVLVPSPRVHGYFLAYSMSVKREAMRVVSNASTIGIMNQDKTKGLIIAIPPAEEQSLIVDYLDDFISNNGELIKQAEQGVSLLQERRSALISAAVTGKIDVRGWQPPAGSSVTTEITQTEMV